MSQPQYKTIVDHIKNQIDVGTLTVQDKLPSERQLSDQFDASRITAREALLQLEKEGIIYRLNRRGWFVSPTRLTYDPTSPATFNEIIKQQQRTGTTTPLSTELSEAPSEVAQVMGLSEGSPVYLIRRLRCVDERPILLEHIYVDANLCPGLLKHDFSQSLTGIFKEHYQKGVTRTDVTMYPTSLDAEDASSLHVSPGSPCLEIRRCRFTEENQVLEYDLEFWRHDAVELKLSFEHQ
ncbi:UTRA domain-containing protein [Litoribacillus peritrichatus]|uniref:UTRA domain-containing protein n=1 Tax=Litoribacillus peritrichatus TaxID=718191 RepID=A0ABP7M9C7_9GAMM